MLRAPRKAAVFQLEDRGRRDLAFTTSPSLFPPKRLMVQGEQEARSIAQSVSSASLAGERGGPNSGVGRRPACGSALPPPQMGGLGRSLAQPRCRHSSGHKRARGSSGLTLSRAATSEVLLERLSRAPAEVASQGGDPGPSEQELLPAQHVAGSSHLATGFSHHP